MNEEVKNRIDKLVSDLKEMFADRLVSVCVYGSAVLDETISPEREAHQNINVLVIMSTLHHKDLERAGVIGKWWDTVAHALPMFLSEEEWLRSHDVYALEAADIRDMHYLAYGKDLFSGVKVDKAALRLICELELHRKLIFLRQRLLVFRDDPKALTDFLYGSVNSFVALFRGVLRLTHTTGNVPQKPREVLEAIKTLVTGYDPAPLTQVLEQREKGAKIPPGDVLPLFESYVDQLAHVVQYVDQKFETIVVKEGVL